MAFLFLFFLRSENELDYYSQVQGMLEKNQKVTIPKKKDER